MADLEYTVIAEAECCKTRVKKPQMRRVHLYTSVAILNIMYAIIGTTFTWSSPMLMKLQLSSADASTVASTITLGGMVGPFLSKLMMDRLGRKGTVAVAMSLVTASYLLLTWTRSVLILVLGRFLAGVSFAITFSAVPVYIAEISEDSVRGVLNTLNIISIASSGLLMFCIAPFISYKLTHYIILSMCTVFFLLFPLLPESPYSLVMKNQTSRAKEALVWLRENRSKSSIENELQIIQKTIEDNKSESSSIKNLFVSKGNRRAFTTCWILLALQQFSGLTVIIYYLQTIFEMTGSSISSSTCSIIIGVIKFVAGFVCPLGVKYFGYKKPLIVSALGAGFGMVGLGVFFTLKFNGFNVDSLNWLPILSVIIYIFFFIGGFANIPWALTGELFPNNVKSIATCLITASCSAIAFLMTKLFPNLILLFGLDYIFLACSFFCFITVTFVALVVKETSGLSFNEIQELLNGRKKVDVLLQQTK